MRCIEDVTLNKDGNDELEKLRNVVSGAVNTESKTKKLIGQREQFLALFKSQVCTFYPSLNLVGSAFKFVCANYASHCRRMSRNNLDGPSGSFIVVESSSSLISETVPTR